MGVCCAQALLAFLAFGVADVVGCFVFRNVGGVSQTFDEIYRLFVPENTRIEVGKLS